MSTKTNRKKCLIVIAAFLCNTGSNAKASFASGNIENVAVIVASVTPAAGDTWTQKADMPTRRTVLSASTVDWKIYAIGGSSILRGAGLSTVEEYDPTNDTWMTKAPMPTSRHWLSASVVNGKIYAIGGTRYTYAPALSMVEEYDPTTNTWTEKAPMPTARFTHSASAVNGKIYVIGGILRARTSGPETPISVVEEYDPATDTWTEKAPMPTARGMLSTSVVNGKIYAIGGTTYRTGLSTVEEYDPTTDTWTTKAPMPTARITFSSSSVVNGIIYVVGGGSVEPAFSTVEAYDPATDTWTTKTSMPRAIAGAATSVVGTKIYAIGGNTALHGTILSTVYEYDTGFSAPSPDFNGDGTVDIQDLLRLIESWGQDEPLLDIAPPPFGDGIIDATDLDLLMRYWEQPVDDPTLITHWAFDETEGIFAADSAGYNDAVVFGGTSWQPGSGKVDGALQLDGIDGCAIAGPAINPAVGPFSILAWVKGGTPGQVIVSQQSAANWLAVDAKGNLMTELKGTSSSTGPLFSESVITDGQWHKIGLVWDGLHRTLSVDGVKVAEDTQPGLERSENGLYIGVGKDYAPDTFFSGLIDDIRIYNRAVSL